MAKTVAAGLMKGKTLIKLSPIRQSARSLLRHQRTLFPMARIWKENI